MASYMKVVIDEENLSAEFKKAFIYECGNALVEIDGIEAKLAKFIVDNNCKIKEALFYKFIDVRIDEALKVGLLSIAVSQGIITNLNYFRSFFQSISDEYAELWKESKKIIIEYNAKTRSIADYMKEKRMITYTPRKGKLHLRCS